MAYTIAHGIAVATCVYTGNFKRNGLESGLQEFEGGRAKVDRYA